MLNELFLNKLNEIGHVNIISHNSSRDLNKINFLKKFKKIYIPKKEIDSFFKQSLLNKVIRQFRLNTCFKISHNLTIKNFNKIFINKRLKNNLIVIFFWRFFQFLLLKIKFLQKILFVLQRINQPKQVKDIFINKKNVILILSSPGWWNYDQFFFSEAKKSKFKVWSFVMNWDQSSAMGLASDKADHYFVWSDHMKRDLINYNNVEEDKISITGPMIYNDYYKFLKKNNHQRKKKKVILIALRSPTRERKNEVEIFLNNLLKLKINFDVKYIVKFHPIHFSKRYYMKAINIMEKFKKHKKIEFYNISELKNVKVYKNLNDKDGDVIKLLKNSKKDFNKKVKLYKNTDLIISFFSTINLESAFFNIPSLNFLDQNKKLSENFVDKKQIDLGVNTFHINRSLKDKSIILVLGYKKLEEKINLFLKERKGNKSILKNELNNLNEKPIDEIIKKINRLVC